MAVLWLLLVLLMLNRLGGDAPCRKDEPETPLPEPEPDPPWPYDGLLDDPSEDGKNTPVPGLEGLEPSGLP